MRAIKRKDEEAWLDVEIRDQYGQRYRVLKVDGHIGKLYLAPKGRGWYTLDDTIVVQVKALQERIGYYFFKAKEPSQ